MSLATRSLGGPAKRSAPSPRSPPECYRYGTNWTDEERACQEKVPRRLERMRRRRCIQEQGPAQRVLFGRE